MTEFLPFIVVGLTSGAVYGLMAMGLVLTYKTSGVLNFGHGAIGMICTYAFYSMRQQGLPTVLAVLAAVCVIAPLLGIALDRVLLRRLTGATAATYIVVSVGLLVALQGLAIAIYGGQTRRVEALLPRSTFQLPGVKVGWDQASVVVISVLVGLGLALFFRITKLGLHTRAVVEDGDLAELDRVDSRFVTSFSWALGSSFAALSGILIAPFIGLDPLLLSLLVLQAFGAAIIGRLRNLMASFVGAIVIAVAASIATKYVPSHPSLAGFPTSLPFMVLFGVLVFSPKGRFVEVVRARASSNLVRPGARLSSRPSWRLMVAGLVGAALLPHTLTGSQLLTAQTGVIYVLLFASLSLVVGLSRQVTLCHVTFVVFGATITSRLMVNGVPLPVAAVLAGLLMAAVGALLAIPALRLSGLFLGLATFGFAVLAQSLFFTTDIGFGREAVALFTRPELLRGEHAFYYCILAVVACGLVAVEAVRSTRLGRTLRALADSRTAMETLGVNPTVPQVLIFCLSAFLAAVTGVLLGLQVGSVSPYSFDFAQSLVWLAVLVTAGAATLGGSVLAALLFICVPAVFTQRAVLEYQPVFFGVAAMLLAPSANGLAGFLRSGRIDLVRLAARGREKLSNTPWRETRRLAMERARS